MTGPSSPVDAEQHRNTIRALSSPGAPLSLESRHATIANPAWFFAPDTETAMRRRLHREILKPYYERLEQVERGRRAIILAGPPGAGKSSILTEVLGPCGSHERSRWLEVDPDELKNALLDAAVADGSYETFIKPPAVRELEEQGEQFYPLDFAALVHEESSQLAKRIREAAIESGANIVIDSVLAKPDAAVELGNRLAAAGYDVEVLDVEVPLEVSAQRVAQRWRDAYLEAVAGRDARGGRWVPEEYVRSVYGVPGERSLSQESAVRLAHECQAVTRYRRYWTPAQDSERVLEQDLAREPSGGALVESRRRSPRAASFPRGTIEQVWGPHTPPPRVLGAQTRGEVERQSER